MGQVSNLTLANNLYSKAMVMREDLSKVLDISGGYAFMSILTDGLNDGQSTSVNVDKIETPYLGSGYIMNPIKGASVIEDDKLVVTLQNPKYANFRLDDLVMVGNLELHGLVVSTEPGKVKLKARQDESLIELQAAFTDGAIMKVFSTLSQNRGSSGRTSLVETPEVEFNYSSVMRESSSHARRDEIESYIKYSGDMWYHAQQPRAMQRFMRYREQAIWYNQRGKFIGNDGQEYDQFGGIDWAIKSSEFCRGNYEPLASLPSMKKFERFMADTLDRRAGADKYKVMLMGRGMLQHIQSTYTKDFIVNAGELNTFGGRSVKGLDVRMYRIAGHEVAFKILDHVNDREFYPEATNIPGAAFNLRQYDTYILDLTPTPVVGGGTVPAIRQYHRGKSRYYEAFIAGIDSNPSNGMTDAFIKAQANRGMWTATDVDQSSYHIMTDCGVTFNAKFSGKMEILNALAA